MPNTQDKRTWFIGGAVAAAVLAGAGWFLLVSPVLADADSARSQQSSVEQQNAITQHKIDVLAQKASQLGTRQHELQVALAALPMDNGLSAFTRQISAQAQASHVVVQNLDVGGFTAVGGAAPAPAATGNGTAAGADATGTGNGTATGTGTSGAGTGAATPPPATAPTGGAVAIQVTITSNGPVARQLAFLHAIQAVGPRRALVTNVGLSSTSASSGSVTWTMTTALTVYATPKSTADRVHIEKLLHQK